MRKLLLSVVALAWVAVASAQTDVTFDFNANEWNLPLSSGNSLEPVAYNNGNISDAISKDGVDVVFKQGARNMTSVTGTNTCPKYFEASNIKHIRFFNKNIMKVLAPAGKAITKIVFEMNSATFNMTNLGAGELSTSDKTWTGNATIVKIKAGANNQIKTMTVTIADKTGETVVPAAEAEEKVFLDFNDPTIHSEFNVTSTTNFSDDMTLTEGARNGSDYLDTDNLIKMTVPYGTTATKNGLYYASSSVYLYLRTGTTTIKCDADKIIKNIKMTFYSASAWNSGNTINGETSSYAELTGDGWTGSSNKVDIAVAGATRIGSITFTIADRPMESETPTAINSAISEEDASNAPVFDLSGRKVTGILTKGIYVKAGKKFVVVK